MMRHTIAWVISPDEGIDGTFGCLSEVTDDCRMQCRVAGTKADTEGCIDGCVDWEAHKVPYEGCRVLDDLDDNGLPQEAYDGPDDTPVRDGDIEVTWDGDHYMWKYEVSNG